MPQKMLSSFFQQLIESLKIQLDHFESEVELLSAGNKKKKMDKEVFLWYKSFSDRIHIWLNNVFHLWAAWRIFYEKKKQQKNMAGPD